MEARFLYESETISGGLHGDDPCRCAISEGIAHQFLYDCVTACELCDIAQPTIVARA